MIVTLPFFYTAQGTPPRKRLPRDFFVRDTATFEIPELDPSDLEPAMTFINRGTAGDGPVEIRTPLSSDGTRLLRPFTHRNGSPFARNEFERLKDAPRGSWPREITADSQAYAYTFSVFHERDEVNPAKITGDNRDRGIAEIQEKITSRLAVVGDDVLVTAPAPCWSISLTAWRERDAAKFVLLPYPQSYVLPPDGREYLDEFRDWYAARTGREIPVCDRTDAEIHSTHVPSGIDPVVHNALALARIAGLHPVRSTRFGERADEAAAALADERTPSAAATFVHELGRAARHPGADRIANSEDNGFFLDVQAKLYEILPDGYKTDPDETLTLGGPAR